MPKDFAGKEKTADTYDKDWVFSKQQGAWITKKQAKKLHREQLAKKAQRNNNAAASTSDPSAAPPTATIPIPTTSDVTPQQEVASGNTPPAWWINTAYTNPTAEQQFANAANAVLPSLSPEDQRNLGNYLATNFKDVYGGYANAQFAPIPTQLTNERQTYFDPSRAQATLNLLDRVQQVAGGEPGKGYDFLKQALNAINQYATPGQPMTREQYGIFSNAIKDMTSQAGGDISAYSNLAQLFNLPGFTAGQLFSNAPIPRLNV